LRLQRRRHVDLWRHHRPHPEVPGHGTAGWCLHRDRPRHLRRDHRDRHRVDAALLPFYALPNAKIYCSQYAFALCFERLVAAGGGNSIATLNGEIQYRYLGTPIVISQKMASTTPTGKIGIIYGDLRKAAAMGERRQVSIKRSDERYFDTDQIGIMGTERVDINVHDVGDAPTAGPLVALKMG
jgi:hypothetical protein